MLKAALFVATTVFAAILSALLTGWLAVARQVDFGGSRLICRSVVSRYLRPMGDKAHAKI